MFNLCECLINCCAGVVQISLMQNFINDLYKGTKLVLRFDLRLLGAAAIHLGLATLESKLPTWNHNIVGNPYVLCS